MKKLLLSLAAGLLISASSFGQTHSFYSGNGTTASGEGYLYQFNGTLTNNCSNYLEWFASGYSWAMSPTAGNIILSEGASNPDTWVHTKFGNEDCNGTVSIDLTGGFTITVRAKATAATTLYATVNGTNAAGTQLILASEGKTNNLTTSFANYTYTFSAADFGTVDPADVEGVTFSIAGDVANSVEFEYILVGDAVISGVKATTLPTSVTYGPNPSADHINVDLSSLNMNEATLKLMNSNGAVVKEVSNSSSISVAELNSGLYFLQINNYAPVKVVVE